MFYYNHKNKMAPKFDDGELHSDKKKEIMNKTNLHTSS